MALKLMYITNQKEVALIAEKYGVDRIFIDLETLGKEERQKGMNTVKSFHSIQDIETIAPLLKKSEVLVRINPWNANSEKEINHVINAGAELIMLPMWRTAEEVRKFIVAVNQRAKTILLLETKEAELCLDDVLDMKGIDEIHIGLNDLHLSYSLTFMFELLANGTVERICKKIKTKDIPYGFGGIARLGMGDLPAEKVLLEHYRLGSTRAILSRSFCNSNLFSDISEFEKAFKTNMEALRQYEDKVSQIKDVDIFEKNRIDVKKCVTKIVADIEKKGL